jgi:hypothetical protein
MLLVVDDAGATIPLITDRLRESNVGLSAIEEYRQPFDEVFVALLRRQEETIETAA